MPFDIRPARVEDAEEFTAVHAAVWRATYVDVMPAETLARLDTPKAVALRRSWIETASADPEVQILVATDDAGAIVGLGASGPGRDEDAPLPLELRAINVLPSAQGSGVSPLLLHALVGDEPAYLWVVDGNDRAIAFYRKHGFEADGGTKTDRDGVREIRMVRR